MRVAIHQCAGVPGDVAANLAILRRAAGDAAGQGARLLILPELFLTGYNLGADLAALAEPLDGPTLQAVGEAARASGLAILTGFCERDGARLYNSAVLVERDGSLQACYRKCHVYGPMENAVFSAGEALVRTTVDGVRIGLLVCYDVEFPETARAHALAGVDLLAVPTTLSAPYDNVARLLVPARAMENQIYLAYANRVGAENGLRYVGQSCIVDPDGRDLARADAASEALIVAEVAPVDRGALAYDYLRDRRPALYAPLTAPRLEERGVPAATACRRSRSDA